MTLPTNLPSVGFARLSQEGLGESAINWDEVSRGRLGLRSGKEQNRPGAIRRVDGPLGQRAPRIELPQYASQFLVRHAWLERQIIFLERGNHAVAGKHRGTLHHSR